jgi:hypothetical protein
LNLLSTAKPKKPNDGYPRREMVYSIAKHRLILAQRQQAAKTKSPFFLRKGFNLFPQFSNI